MLIILIRNKNLVLFMEKLWKIQTSQKSVDFVDNSLVKNTWDINGTAESFISLFNDVGITGFIFCKVFTL